MKSMGAWMFCKFWGDHFAPHLFPIVSSFSGRRIGIQHMQRFSNRVYVHTKAYQHVLA